MVSLRLSAAGAAARRAAPVAGALIALACGRAETAQQADAGGSLESRLAEKVRAQYRAPDVEAAGAWVWTGPDSLHYVLVDAQSAIQGIVQARAELWLASETDAALFGRSEVLPSAAEIGAYQFDDISGDGVPDLLGFVADSAAERYPVFFPGARPGMTEEIALAAPGWRFSVEEEHAPVTFGAPRPCALQLWAEDPVPENGAAGWRWLSLQRDGRLLPPRSAPPTCGDPGAPGVQPTTARP